ncbi:hypothetical protein HanIR_Chr15g0741291 [Helianthus annuus]|nr:hypothetical protein HanIR_Chr15g0741291 [Helianthus annuus]
MNNGESKLKWWDYWHTFWLFIGLFHCERQHTASPLKIRASPTISLLSSPPNGPTLIRTTPLEWR